MNECSIVKTISNKSLIKHDDGIKLEKSSNYIEVLKPIGYNKKRRLYIEYDKKGSVVSLHVTKDVDNILQVLLMWIVKNGLKKKLGLSCIIEVIMFLILKPQKIICM